MIQLVGDLLQQWQLRDSANRPSEYAQRQTVEFIESNGLRSVQDGLRIAIMIDEAIAHGCQQGVRDATESSTSLTATRSVAGVAPLLQYLQATIRETYFQTSMAPCQQGDDVSTFVASLRASVAFAKTVEDVASALRAPVSSVLQGLVVEGALSVSAGYHRVFPHAISLLSGATLVVDLPAVVHLHGDIEAHWWNGLLPGVRLRHHQRGQWVRPGHDSALIAFVEKQARVEGWCQGDFPHGFWSRCWAALNVENPVEHKFPSPGALGKGYKRAKKREEEARQRVSQRVRLVASP
jgi:hypothetical protein